MKATGASLRRGTLAALGLAAAAAVVIGLVFFVAWGGYVRDFEPSYFRQQGAAWGNAYRRRIEDLIATYLETRPHGEIIEWPRTFPRWIGPTLAAEFEAQTGSRPVVLTLFERASGDTVFRWPQDAALPGDPHEFGQLEFLDGISVAAADPNDEGIDVLLETPLEARTPLEGAYGLRCVLRFQPLDFGVARGRNYAAFLVLAYLAILYGLLFLVYRLGRRETELGFAAREREIRLKAIGSVAEGIAHEIRNPLNAVALNVQYIEKVPEKLGRAAESKDFERVYTELGRIRRVMDHFVSFTALRDLTLSSWSLRELVDEVATEAAPRFADAEATLDVDVRAEIEMFADRPKFRLVLAGIVRNALEALTGAETRLVRVVADIDRKDQVCVSVRDFGPEPDPVALERIFDPYFTTSTSTRGLGMTLAKTVVESHGGTIAAAAAQGGGSAVVIEMPRNAGAAN